MMRIVCTAILLLASVLPAADAPTESINTRILNRATSLLADDAHWNRADTRNCPTGAAKISLYCALRQATEEVMGQSSHRTPAMEEVRARIEEKSRRQEK